MQTVPLDHADPGMIVTGLEHLTEGEQPSRSFQIRAMRELAGLSQCDLAMRAGLLPDHLRALEDGVEPTAAEWQAIEAALGVQPISTLA